MTDGSLWYAAYGSNLDGDRFCCYLRGGRPPGASRTYPGARAPVARVDDRAVTLRGRLSFAWESPTWGGGIAFFQPGHDGTVLARAYLLTRTVLADVVEQEMWRVPGAEHDFTEVLDTGRQVLGPGRYETLFLVGHLEGRPVVTFGSADVTGLGLRAPAGAYVATVARGLRRTHGLDDEAVVAYLLGCPGVGLGWDALTLLTAVSESR